MITDKEIFEYHQGNRPGKIEVVPTKPCSNQFDLSLAYTPGVAKICEAIEQEPRDSFRYTARGNLIGVISNGTAILGLGNLGPEAAKPVMEGKAVLFKKFAGIDVFDLEINETDPDKLIEIVKSMEPTFGGINLEDIKAPECFEVEKKLIEQMNIPVFHDDQHGTAIISAAALLNALELQNKKIDEIRITVSGAGAAAVACCNLFLEMGAHRENIVMVDSRGVVTINRTDINQQKRLYATRQDLETLEDAMRDCDLFLGVSVRDLLTADMIASMAENPIVFALANPDPEIPYPVAMSVRKDLIMATGRSDYPNQVNNVLGFPFIFRGALDCNATEINVPMKIAAAQALADLAKLPVTDQVLAAYDDEHLEFGPEYIIPKPFDQRALTMVASAVARAAMESGVARNPIDDFDAYEQELLRRVDFS
jgi:malate dehydrogenase (oxaloacetate-decarboxylating)(NADP+)